MLPFGCGKHMKKYQKLIPVSEISHWGPKELAHLPQDDLSLWPPLHVEQQCHTTQTKWFLCRGVLS